jgi:ribosomal protein S13
MDPNELQAVSEALEQLRQGGTVSAETLAKLGGTTQNVNKALEGYTKKLLGATSAIGGMAKQIEEGGGSFKSMSGTIQGVANGLGKIAGMIPGVGGALKVLTGALGEAAGYVLDRMDDITKNYQSLGDASAGAADGFDGLLRQFNQMGNYSLPAFTKAVKANTAGLAALGGNAAMGAEELSKVAGVLTTKDTARQFLKLGISLDAVGDATAGYLADYARAGVLQGNTTEQLTKKTQDYILEVDKIARLTGQTRAQQEDERRKSMANAQFRAQLAQMNASGQQDNAAALKTFANAIGGPAADAIRAYSTGIPLTTQAAEANLFTNDKLREITLKVRDGQLSAAQATVELQDALGQGVNTFGTLTAYGKDLGGIFVQAADQQAILNEQNKSATERLADAEANQKKMIDSESNLTETFVDANLATAGAAKNIQSLGFSLASLAAGPVKKFADGLEYATGALNKRFGIGGTTSTPAGVDRGAAGGPRAAMGGVVPGRSVTIGDQVRTGGDRNWRNNNPGNIEYGPFAIKYGAIGSDGRFAIFPSEEQGRMAQDALLKSKNYANLSLADAVKRYAPSNENDPKSYARQIMAQTGIDQNMRYADLTPEQQSRVLDAMKRIEGGRAGTVSGPTGSRTNAMSDVNYNGAGVATQAQGQKAQAQQAEKTEITGLAQVLERIEYNTRNGAREQQKTNRLVS